MFDKNDVKIFINPGHCNPVDPGAVRKWNGVEYKEAEIVDSLSLKLKDELVSEGYQVEVEQSDNLCGERSSKGVSQRYENSVCYHANKWQANLFISLHCNAFNGENAYGVETWYHPGSTSGSKLAYLINDKICKDLGMADRMDVVEGNPNKAKNLMVIKNTNMPAVLVELGFLSNPKDADKLINRQDMFTESIASAIDTYLA